MFSTWPHIPAAPFLRFHWPVRAAIAFAICSFGDSVVIAADFLTEGFWMTSQRKHIRVEGEWRAVVHVYKHKPFGDLPGFAHDEEEEADPWRVSFFLSETATGEQQAEFYQITFKARITDTAIHLVPEYGPDNEGRLDYTRTDDGLHIQQSSIWPELLRKKDLPYPPLMQGAPNGAGGGMLFKATTLIEATEAAYRTIDRFLPRLAPGPIPEGDRDLSRVREILRRSDAWIGKSYGEVYAAKLMHLGPKAEMVLAQILNNVDEGDQRGNAARALVAMDRVRAGPLVLRNLPDLDSGVINEILSGYLYDLEHGRDLPFKAELYASAVKLLESWLVTASAPASERRWRGGGLSNSSTEVLRVVGMLGSEEDFPLLRRLQAVEPSISGTSSEWIQMMLSMALGRLGEPTALGQIRENLSRSLPSPLTTARSRELCNWLIVAGFTQNEEFVPAICRFLETHPPRPDEPDPSVNAAQALDQIIHKRGWSDEASGTDWKTWWKANQTKYSQ